MEKELDYRKLLGGKPKEVNAKEFESDLFRR